eukprot:TRINITY_DN6260_c1_g1_i2.p1 TRINITY_DN6260_c1_g1~~TRINITY_DN6260_c1_g1_i2.p1  ORF type:complete len:789 (+),score=122.23 TRINITY_DN6260_c1_g1_i2:47-2413(+)
MIPHQNRVLLVLLGCILVSSRTVIWTSSVEGGELVIYSDDSYDILIDGATVLQSEVTRLHSHGKWLSPDNGLTKVSSGQASGDKANIGKWEGYYFLYQFNSTGEVKNFKTTFQVVTGTGLLLFEQYFENGAEHVNVTGLPPNQSSTAHSIGEFSSSTSSFSLFPSVRVAPSFPLGTVTWSGRFSVFSQETTLKPIGSEGGPYVIYNKSSIDTNSTAVTWGPFDNLKSNILGMQPSTDISGAGLQGMITSIPAGTKFSSCLVFAKGVTNSIHKYGSYIRKGLGKQNYNETKSRLGLTTTVLSYWTDNGAFYDWYRWSNITASGTPQDVLISLHKSFLNNNLPVKYTQLDAYWYPFIQKNGNCKINDSVKENVFPKGLEYLADQIGPLLLYSGPTCNNSTYWKENGGKWDATYSIDYNAGWAQGQLANIHPDSSFDFYNSVFQKGRSQHGMAEFEIDFLDFNYLLFPLFLQNHTASEDWLRGMADAAHTNNMTIQYCMTLPSDLLVSANFDSVSNTRASQDYTPGYWGSYHIGGSALLISAMGLGASKDNFWTMVNESDISGRKGGEPNGELNAMVCSLTSGPVGFADAIGYTNYSVLWPTTSQSGSLLHGSRPLTPLESTFYSGTGSGAGAWHTHSQVSDSFWYSVLLTAVGPHYQLSTSDFYPRPSDGSQYVVLPWSSQCRYQSKLGDCAVYLNSTFEVTRHSTSIATYALLNVAEYKNDMAFIGEVDKYVHMSPDRFSSFTRSSSSLTATAVGSPGEEINWACVISGTLFVYKSHFTTDILTLTCRK